ILVQRRALEKYELILGVSFELVEEGGLSPVLLPEKSRGVLTASSRVLTCDVAVDAF
mgnify:CR=1